MSLQSLVENLTLREGPALLSRLCLDLTIFFATPDGPETRQGVIRFYQQALEQFGSHWTWYENESTPDGPRRVHPGALDILPRWFSATARPRAQYQLLLRAGEKDDDIGTTAFEIGAFGRGELPGFLRLSLPVTFLERGAAEYAALCDALVFSMPFLSARAGYSLRWDEYGKRHHRQGLKHAEFIAEWYRGIDLPDDSMTILEGNVAEEIQPVGWLTYLSASLLERVGGIDALKNSLQAPVTIRTYEDRAVLQAGPIPQTGNSPIANDLAAYEAVARALSGITAKEHSPIVKNIEAWLARFENVVVQ